MIKIPLILYDVLSYILITIAGSLGVVALFITFFRKNKTLKVYEYEPIGTEDLENNNIEIDNEQEATEENALLV